MITTSFSSFSLILGDIIFIMPKYMEDATRNVLRAVETGTSLRRAPPVVGDTIPYP